MAGWDFTFETHADDQDLALKCFRILRRACGRYGLGFHYYSESHPNEQRLRFVLAFAGRPPALWLAAADFDLEMRAVSLLQDMRRKARLPLRLLAHVLWSGSDEPIESQLDSSLVAKDRKPRVTQHLVDYSIAYGSWLRNEIAPAEYLEAQHSLVTNLILDLVPDTDIGMPFPKLVEAAKFRRDVEKACLELGTARNKVKHRGRRHEAARYAETFVQAVGSAARLLTGYDMYPRTAALRRWEADETSVFRQPPPFKL